MWSIAGTLDEVDRSKNHELYPHHCRTAEIIDAKVGAIRAIALVADIFQGGWNIAHVASHRSRN